MLPKPEEVPQKNKVPEVLGPGDIQNFVFFLGWWEGGGGGGWFFWYLLRFWQDLLFGFLAEILFVGFFPFGSGLFVIPGYRLGSAACPDGTHCSSLDHHRDCARVCTSHLCDSEAFDAIELFNSILHTSNATFDARWHFCCFTTENATIHRSINPHTCLIHDEDILLQAPLSFLDIGGTAWQCVTSIQTFDARCGPTDCFLNPCNPIRRGDPHHHIDLCLLFVNDSAGIHHWICCELWCPAKNELYATRMVVGQLSVSDGKLPKKHLSSLYEQYSLRAVAGSPTPNHAIPDDPEQSKDDQPYTASDLGSVNSSSAEDSGAPRLCPRCTTSPELDLNETPTNLTYNFSILNPSSVPVG